VSGRREDLRDALFSLACAFVLVGGVLVGVSVVALVFGDPAAVSRASVTSWAGSIVCAAGVVLAVIYLVLRRRS
jgi:hypothetical protein